MPEERQDGDDARWQQVLSDPVVSADTLMTTAYRPTPRLRSHVESRDGGCIGPACEHSTQHLELDHTVNFGETDAEGRRGTTSADNLAPECLRVHHAKTHGGWRLRQPSPGQFEWTSPTGRRYRSSARPVLPGWKPP